MSGIPMTDPTITIEHERKALLYQADGKALVRTAVFVPAGARMALQTSGQAPKLNIKPKATGGKKRSGKRGC